MAANYPPERLFRTTRFNASGQKLVSVLMAAPGLFQGRTQCCLNSPDVLPDAIELLPEQVHLLVQQLDLVLAARR